MFDCPAILKKIHLRCQPYSPVVGIRVKENYTIVVLHLMLVSEAEEVSHCHDNLIDNRNSHLHPISKQTECVNIFVAST